MVKIFYVLVQVSEDNSGERIYLVSEENPDFYNIKEGFANRKLYAYYTPQGYKDFGEFICDVQTLQNEDIKYVELKLMDEELYPIDQAQLTISVVGYKSHGCYIKIENIRNLCSDLNRMSV